MPAPAFAGCVSYHSGVNSEVLECRRTYVMARHSFPTEDHGVRKILNTVRSPHIHRKTGTGLLVRAAPLGDKLSQPMSLTLLRFIQDVRYTHIASQPWIYSTVAGKLRKSPRSGSDGPRQCAQGHPKYVSTFDVQSHSSHVREESVHALPPLRFGTPIYRIWFVSAPFIVGRPDGIVADWLQFQRFQC